MAKFTDGPAGDPFDATFDPPAVQNAQARNPIKRRLHSAGTRRFKRKLRSVQPQVRPGRDFSADFEVVVVQKYHLNGFLESFPRPEYLPDQFLASAILRMGLARKNNLEFAGAAGNFAQPVQVRQNQVSALVAGGTARKSNRKSVGIQTQTGLLLHFLEEIVLCQQVRGPNLFLRQPQGVAQREIVLAPCGDVSVKDILQRRAGPGGSVDTVRDRLNVL